MGDKEIKGWPTESPLTAPVVLLPEPLFRAEMAVITPGARTALAELQLDPMQFVSQHYAGDWGLVSADDKQRNDEALRDGGRLLSQYELPTGQRLWVLTEALRADQRAATTLLLPEEY